MYTTMLSGCAENERNVGKMSSPLTSTKIFSSELGKLVNYVGEMDGEWEGERREEDREGER